jgi:uncharacterized protein YndB with AHSA1/START domain
MAIARTMDSPRRAVDPPHTLEFEDGFADADGNPSPDTPTGVIRVALSELAGGGTRWTSPRRGPASRRWNRYSPWARKPDERAVQIDELLSLPARA